MAKAIIVRVKKTAGKVNPVGVQPNEAVPQGISDTETAILHERVATLYEKNNRVSDQAQLIMNMDDNVFDTEAAVGLLQRIAVLDGMATVLTRRLVEADFGEYPINTCRGIRENAERMYSDMKRRLSGEE